MNVLLSGGLKVSNNSTPVAVVSGAAGGIGAACAVRLAQDGFDVVIVDIKPAEETYAAVLATGRRCDAVVCDVTRPGSVQALSDLVGDKFGRCDVLLNNAGFYSFVPLEDLSYEVWRQFMALNLDGAFLMSKAFAPLMKKRHHGRIIALASNSFYSNVPGMIAYVATKGGLIGLMRGLASELGPEGITANLVAPGPILTEQLKAMLPRDPQTTVDTAVEGFFEQIMGTQAIKRVGMPTDVADVVSFLASANSSFVTGQTIVIDGGCVRL
jgi:NAD(P)-dependent dehydrogenase (short-subunit alcohol dehydrogenase family)